MFFYLGRVKSVEVCVEGSPQFYFVWYDVFGVDCVSEAVVFVGVVKFGVSYFVCGVHREVVVSWFFWYVI